jgi:hypothetical protein
MLIAKKKKIKYNVTNSVNNLESAGNFISRQQIKTGGKNSEQ